jgi:hypothetical protein
LLGRRSYEWLAARWPSRSGDLAPKIFPVVVGGGERLFGETNDRKPMRLVDARTVEGDVAFLTYERSATSSGSSSRKSRGMTL